MNLLAWISPQGENLLDSFYIRNMPVYLLKNEVLHILVSAWEDKN